MFYMFVGTLAPSTSVSIQSLKKIAAPSIRAGARTGAAIPGERNTSRSSSSVRSGSPFGRTT